MNNDWRYESKVDESKHSYIIRAIENCDRELINKELGQDIASMQKGISKMLNKLVWAAYTVDISRVMLCAVVETNKGDIGTLKIAIDKYGSVECEYIDGFNGKPLENITNMTCDIGCDGFVEILEVLCRIRQDLEIMKKYKGGRVEIERLYSRSKILYSLGVIVECSSIDIGRVAEFVLDKLIQSEETYALGRIAEGLIYKVAEDEELTYEELVDALKECRKMIKYIELGYLKIGELREGTLTRGVVISSINNNGTKDILEIILKGMRRDFTDRKELLTDEIRDFIRTDRLTRMYSRGFYEYLADSLRNRREVIDLIKEHKRERVKICEVKDKLGEVNKWAYEK